MSFFDQLEHHLYAIDEKGETLLNVSPTIKRRRSAGDKRPQGHGSFGKVESSNEKIGSFTRVRKSPVSLSDLSWLERENISYSHFCSL